jgi:hypothetical protein
MRDLIATVLVAAIGLPCVGYLINGEMPFIKDPRGMSAVGLVLGAVAFLVMRSGDAVDRLGKTEIGLATVSLVLGAVALALAETAAAGALLAIFMASILVVCRRTDGPRRLVARRGPPDRPDARLIMPVHRREPCGAAPPLPHRSVPDRPKAGTDHAVVNLPSASTALARPVLAVPLAWGSTPGCSGAGAVGTVRVHDGVLAARARQPPQRAGGHRAADRADPISMFMAHVASPAGTAQTPVGGRGCASAHRSGSRPAWLGCGRFRAADGRRRHRRNQRGDACRRNG